MDNKTKLTVSTLSTRGEGIARVDGKAVFVPFTLPGETWEVEIIERKKNFERGLPLELIERSDDAPQRITPTCPYYAKCGGCHLQHIAYEDQRSLKREWLKETFRRVAHLEVEPDDVESSPPWQYRNKIVLPLRTMRGKIVFAFHHVYQPNKPVMVEDCSIAHPVIRQAMPLIQQALNDVRPSIKTANRKRPQASRVQFQVVNDRLSVRFFDVLFSPESANNILKLASMNDELFDEIILRGESKKEIRQNAAQRDSVAPEEIDIAADSFFQVNDVVRQKLYQHVIDLPYQSMETVLDGYCGVGFLTMSLSSCFKHATGVELNKASAKEAKRLVELEDLSERIKIVNDSIEKFLQYNSEKSFDCVVLNPPRAGLSNEVREEIIKKSAPEMVIVSCHPAALARDVKSLVDSGYQIQSIVPFDMFPQTYHLETVIHLKK